MRHRAGSEVAQKAASGTVRPRHVALDATRHNTAGGVQGANAVVDVLRERWQRRSSANARGAIAMPRPAVAVCHKLLALW